MRNKLIALLLAAIMVIGIFAAFPADARADETVTIRFGEEGKYISVLQQKLADKGCYSFEFTNFFGDITFAAVKKFQERVGLEPDGVAGPATINNLFGSAAADFNASVIKERKGGSNTSDNSSIVLRQGDDSKFVSLLQTRLKEKGYFTYGEITTFFGAITQKAVEGYQADAGLDVDGVAGPITLKKLFGSKYNDFLKGNYTPGDGGNDNGGDRDNNDGNNGDSSNSKLSPGDEGEAVKKLQQRLAELEYFRNDITSYYGPATMNAVKAFQENNDLYVDGIAGPKTLKVLYSNKAILASDKKRQSSGGNDGGNGNGGGNGGGNDNGNGTTADEVIAYAKKYLGKPYVYGANGPDSFDCSGFTKFVFKKFGITLPRSAYDQGYKINADRITSISELKKGDLVFFDTISDSDRSDHAGIYIGNGEFIHASSSSSGRCVRISSLTSGYYNRVFSWGKRVL